MDSQTINNFDVLTVTVLLPESDSDRNALFEYIANNGDIQGGVALNAMHGNLINHFRAQAGLDSHESVEKIMAHLDANTRAQVSSAISKMRLARVDAADGQSAPAKPHVGGSVKFGLMMFVLGALVSYNFF